MKKICFFIVSMVLATIGFAQNPDNAKLNLIVGNFSGDYSNQQRNNVISTLIGSHRANVIEKSVYDALPQEVRAKMHIDAIITGKCSMKTESEQTTRTDKNGNKKNVTVYTSTMTTEMTFTNPSNNSEMLHPVFESSSSDESRSKSVSDAIRVGHTRGKQTLIVVQLLTLDEYLQYVYPLKGKIVTVNEVKKSSAESVSINLGSRDAIYRSQTFEIVSYKNGKEKNYGRLRVREINNDSLSTCRVDKGGKEIMKAIENGEEVEIVSYVQPISLNGLVRVEQEAPRLNVTSIDEVRKRNLAFGGITGNAPSKFVNEVRSQLKQNIRVNAFALGDAGCPSLDDIDGIAIGYYTGTKNSHQLVKAEDHILQLKDYTEYRTYIGWYLFIVNPKTGEIIYSGSQGYTAISDKSAEEASEEAIRGAANISSATYSAYPLIGTITTIDNGDPKKAKDVSIDLGSNFPVFKGLVFDVYSEDASGGWEKIGRIELTNVEDGSRSQCTVKKGGEEIRKAVEDGLPVRITTYILKEFFDL